MLRCSECLKHVLRHVTHSSREKERIRCPVNFPALRVIVVIIVQTRPPRQTTCPRPAWSHKPTVWGLCVFRRLDRRHK